MFKQSIVTAALVFSMSSLAHAAEPKSYVVDAAHSKVGFEIPHLVISTVDGKFTTYQSEIQLAEPFAQSKFSAEIEVQSVDTGVKDRDEHLRSPDFFDVKKYPKITFKTTGVSGQPGAFKLTGDLTIHGVTKKVTLDAKVQGPVLDPYGNEKISLVAKTVVNRKDFGLAWGKMVEAGPIVGDDVTLDIKLEAGRPAAKKTN